MSCGLVGADVAAPAPADSVANERTICAHTVSVVPHCAASLDGVSTCCARCKQQRTACLADEFISVAVCFRHTVSVTAIEPS